MSSGSASKQKINSAGLIHKPAVKRNFYSEWIGAALLFLPTKHFKRRICNELFTWADVYDTANHDERRAILQQFIKEIRVRKDYEISITLNASFNQVEQLKAVSTYDGAEIFEEISENGA